MSDTIPVLNTFQPIDYLVPHLKKQDIKLYQALKNLSDAELNLNNYVGGISDGTVGIPGPPGSDGGIYQAGPAGNGTGNYVGSYQRSTGDKVKEYPDIWDFTIDGIRYPNPDEVDLPHARISVSGTDYIFSDPTASYIFTAADINKSVTLAGCQQPVSGVQTNWYGFIDHLHPTNPNACYLRGSSAPINASGILGQFGTDNGQAFIALMSNTSNPHIPYGNWYKKGSCLWSPGQHITADGGFTTIIQGDDNWAFEWEPNSINWHLVNDYTGFARPMSMDSLRLYAFRGIKTGSRYVDSSNAVKATGNFILDPVSLIYQAITVTSIQQGTIDSSLVGSYFAAGNAFAQTPAVQGWITSVTGSGVGATIVLDSRQAAAGTEIFEVGTQGAIWQSNPFTHHYFNNVTVYGYYDYVTDPDRGNPNWLVAGFYAPLRDYDTVDAIGGTGILTTQDFTCKFSKCNLYKSGIAYRCEGSIEVTFDNCWLGFGGRAIDAINPLDVYFRGTSAEMFLDFCKITSFSEQAVINAPFYTGITINVHEWETFSHHPQIVCGNSLRVNDTSFGINTIPSLVSFGINTITTGGVVSSPAGGLFPALDGGIYYDYSTGYTATFNYTSPTAGLVTPPPSAALTSFPWAIIKDNEQPPIQILCMFGLSYFNNSTINITNGISQKVLLNTDYSNLVIDSSFLTLDRCVGFECMGPFAVVEPRVAPYYATANNFPHRGLGGIQWDNSQGPCFGACSCTSGSANITILTSLSEAHSYTNGLMGSVYNGCRIHLNYLTQLLDAYIVSVTGTGNGAVVVLDRPWPYATNTVTQYNAISQIGWVQETGNEFLTIKRNVPATAGVTIGFDLQSPTHRAFEMRLSAVKRSGPTHLLALLSPGVAGTRTLTLASAPPTAPVIGEYIEVGQPPDSPYDFEYAQVTAYNSSTHVMTLDKLLTWSGATFVTLGPMPRLYSATLTDAKGNVFNIGGFNGLLTGLPDNSTTLKDTDTFRVNIEDSNLFGPTPADLGPGTLITVSLASQPVEIFEIRLDPITHVPQIYWDAPTQSLVVQSDIAPWNNPLFATFIDSGDVTYKASIQGYNAVQLRTRSQGDHNVLEAYDYGVGGSNVSISTAGVISGDIGWSPQLHGGRLHITSSGANFTMDMSNRDIVPRVTVPPGVAVTTQAWSAFPLPAISPGDYPYGSFLGQVGWFQGFTATPKLICPDVSATSLRDVNLGTSIGTPSAGDAVVYDGSNYQATAVPSLSANQTWSGDNLFTGNNGFSGTNTFTGVCTFTSTTNLVTRKVMSPSSTSPGITGSTTYSAAQITAILFAINTLITDMTNIMNSQNS